ncbi:MAG: hypothetical protein A4E28_02590 [Methanocella sp. PtaU1.Bin125]|nr:MAG: hypothetical protein A4E28_02590 [Methanocella sp. PtaU1.Bin125]
MTMDRTSDAVDWAAVWKARMTDNQRLKGGTECAALWRDRKAAERYDSHVSSNGRARAMATLGLLQVSPAMKVLDIGAGPGTHAIPLARMGCRVTAVEPSPGMADVLAENVKAGGLGNVAIITKRWEDVPLSGLDGPYDVVLASLSLGMPDIRAALEKMDRACMGKVYLIWPAGVTAWEQNYRDAWPILHGKPYVSGPKADVLFNVLYQMGICPDVRVYRDEHEERFGSLDEAITHYRPMYSITTPEQEVALRKYLGRKLDRAADGLTMRGVSLMALLSWDVMTSRLQG